MVKEEQIKAKSPLQFYILFFPNSLRDKPTILTQGTDDPETALQQFNDLLDGKPLHPNQHPDDPVRYNNFGISILVRVIKRVDRHEIQED